MKKIWESLRSKGRKYKNGSTATLSKAKVNGKTKWFKMGGSSKPTTKKK